MNSYDLGDLITLSATFTVSSVATNPTATTCKVREPSGTITTFTYGTDAELVRDSTGLFHLDWTAAERGVHYYRFAGTGAAHGAAEASFNVRESAF